MTDPRCAQARELAPEVALGVAPVEERARVLEHIVRCAGCRAYLAELSGVADDLLSLAPRAEPPSGFESAVLARLDSPGAAPRNRGKLRRALQLAAVIALVAALSGGAVWQAGQPDRELADQVRQTLATADGKYFAAYPLRNPDGAQRGSVFAYEGEPTWLVCALDEPLPKGWYEVQLVTLDGERHQLASGPYLGGLRAWGAELPVAVDETAQLRILDKQGRPVLSARL
ncbi:MAG: hypothetical protein GEU94_16005 [Micromonosporaceae bacterium]|nr:hypothetical protein [Micromonosporaceae bacterium]